MGGGDSVSIREGGEHRRVNVIPIDYVTYSVAFVFLFVAAHHGRWK